MKTKKYFRNTEGKAEIETVTTQTVGGQKVVTSTASNVTAGSVEVTEQEYLQLLQDERDAVQALEDEAALRIEAEREQKSKKREAVAKKLGLTKEELEEIL